MCRGVAQLVARLVRDEEAAGSSPVTPTTPKPMTGKGLSHFSTLHGEPAKRAQNPEWLAR